MTCRACRSLAALAAGGDLDGRKQQRWEKHLAACPDCRREFRQVQESLARVRSLARREQTPDWPEAAWRRAVNRAVEQARRPAAPASLRLPGWAWAGAAGLLVALIAAGVFVLKPGRAPRPAPERNLWADIILPETAPPAPAEPGTAPALRPRPAASSSRRPAAGQPALPPPRHPAPTVTAMTFVSQETGLTVHWIFNDAFIY